MRASFHLHVIHDVCLIVCWFLPRSVLLLFLSVVCLFSFSPPMSTVPKEITAAPSHNEESCPLAEFTPLTVYEPNQPDNSDYSETYAVIFQNESVDIDTDPSYSCDAELDDELVGKALPSPLFTQDREEPADRRQAYHSHEESLLSAQSFFAHARMERPAHELSSCQKKKVKSRNGKRKNQDSPRETKRANSRRS